MLNARGSLQTENCSITFIAQTAKQTSLTTIFRDRENANSSCSLTLMFRRFSVAICVALQIVFVKSMIFFFYTRQASHLFVDALHRR
jgi:hypothetical protein